MPDMGYEAIKKVLLQVKEICGHTNCVSCPFRKAEKETGIPWCPLSVDKFGMEVGAPAYWDIDEWREDTK